MAALPMVAPDAPAGPLQRVRVDARALAVALALGAIGLGAAFGSSAERGDAVRALAWIAIWAAPAGFLAARLRLGSAAIVAPGSWMLALVWLETRAEHPLGAPAAGALAFTALFAVGLGLGSLSRARPWRGTAILAGVGAVLAAAPQGAGLGREPWSPAVTAGLFDLSPVAFVVESAGADWMRHPAVYGPAGTSRLGPELRRAHGGVLAGCAVLLVGCALTVEGRRRTRRRASEPPMA